MISLQRISSRDLVLYASLLHGFSLWVDHAELLIRVHKNGIRAKLTSTHVVLICSTYFTWPVHLPRRCIAVSRNFDSHSLMRGGEEGYIGWGGGWKIMRFFATNEFDVLRKNWILIQYIQNSQTCKLMNRIHNRTPFTETHQLPKSFMLTLKAVARVSIISDISLRLHVDYKPCVRMPLRGFLYNYVSVW